MSGTIAGGKKASQTNLKKDPNFYAKIGAKGGRNGNTGGFASGEVGDDGLTGRERAAIVGQKGGRKSRRTPASAVSNKSSHAVTLAPLALPVQKPTWKQWWDGLWQ